MKNPELKPCPFCGDEARIFVENADILSIGCMSLNCYMYEGLGIEGFGTNSREEMIQAWNKGGIVMKNDLLYEALDLINTAQIRVLRVRSIIESDKANSAKESDNTNRAFEVLNSARIFIKEAISP